MSPLEHPAGGRDRLDRERRYATDRQRERALDSGLARVGLESEEPPLPGPVSALSSRTYSRSIYSVTIRADGAIRVQDGDWLSKYSVALHDSFFEIHEYLRWQQGRWVRVPDPDRIYAGEVLYHEPTLREYLARHKASASVPAPPSASRGDRSISEQEKRQLVLDTLNSDFRFDSRTRWAVGVAMDIVDHANLGLELITLVVLVQGAGLTAAIGVVGLVACFLAPISAMMDIARIARSFERHLRWHAAAFSVTAFAFGDDPPRLPEPVANNIRERNRYEGPRVRLRTDEEVEEIVAGYRAMWDEAVATATDGLMAKLEEVRETCFRHICRDREGAPTADTLRLGLRASAGDDRNKLVEMVWTGHGARLNPGAEIAFKGYGNSWVLGRYPVARSRQAESGRRPQR